MKSTISFVYLFLFVGCAASKIIPTTSENSEKLLKKFELNKTQEKKFTVTKIEKKAVTKIEKKEKAKAPKKIKKKKKIKITKIENKPVSKKIKKDYPKKFEDYDKISKKSWQQYEFNYFENEEHKFEISYLGITAGYATLSSEPLVMIDGRKALHLKARMVSADFYSGIYKLDDLLEVYLDKETMLPIKYTMLQRESGQSVDDLQLFDRENNQTQVYYYRLKDGKEKKYNKKVKIPKFFGDSFSPLYFSRGLPLKIGEKYEYPVVTRGKIWILKLEPVEIDEIEVMDEDVEAIRVKAETRFPGVLKKRGDIIFWYSNDDEKRLLKFEAKVKIGSIAGELVDFKKGSSVE